jgi:hypothetical protein
MEKPCSGEGVGMVGSGQIWKEFFQILFLEAFMVTK